VIRIGIDTGGTFTDVVAVDDRTGRLVTTKTPSTPADPAEGFLAGITKVLDLVDAGTIASVAHGTTVATNALLQDDFGALGFVTTAGFRALLEIARQSVPDGYGNSYFWVKPDRIVPLDLVREVPERLDHTGAVVRPLDTDAAAEIAAWYRDRGITAVGICLLHAYANPAHEQRVRDVFAEVHPGCAVSISSDVLREYREYERSVTTLVDASVKPRMTAYVRGIAERLAGVAGAGAPFWVMKSNGGVIGAGEIAAQPITTIMSGPAAGALGAGVIARAAGLDRVLTLDGGGTSTDVCVVTGGEPAVTTEGRVGRFPVKIPMVDVVTVGTGGGSVAWVPPEGGLKVGPRSAGADPGPLCYGRGGTEPTVTDAALVLGRIPPYLLGGEIALDVDAARAGIEALAAAVGMTAEACAAGVCEIAAWNQANAIRQVTVKRGLDVRDFVMATFGGSGPLQCSRLLDILGLRGVLVPAAPGNVSAFGLLTVDVRNDYVQTMVARHDALDLTQVAARWAELEARAAEALGREGFDRTDHRYARAADLRYFGQASEVRVPAPPGPVDGELAAAVVGAFHDAHERLYGYCYRDDDRKVVEWVNLRLVGVGPIHTPDLPTLDRGDGDPGHALVGSRDVWWDGGWVHSRRYDRAALRAGDVVTGPAIIEEYGSTVPLAPGLRAVVDDHGNLNVDRGGTG
jgi:N-methylhydantoinase A